MSTLTGQFIADTYPFVLHTTGTPISGGGIAQVFDGSGYISSLQIGLSGKGVNVLGPLSASGIKYPTFDPGPLSVAVSDGNKSIALSSFSSLIKALGGAGDGTYTNPTLVISNGVITTVTSNNTGGLSAFSTVGGSTFTVPPNVRKVKFTVTGAGGRGGTRAGGAGGTVTGYLATTPNQNMTINVGNISTNANGGAGAQSSIVIDGVTIAYGNGGNTTLTSYGYWGGGIGGVTVGASQLLSYYTVQGGAGGADTGDNDESSVGAAGLWGSGPAYGGGGGGDNSGEQGMIAGIGFVLLEW